VGITQNEQFLSCDTILLGVSGGGGGGGSSSTSSSSIYVSLVNFHNSNDDTIETFSWYSVDSTLIFRFSMKWKILGTTDTDLQDLRNCSSLVTIFKLFFSEY